MVSPENSASKPPKPVQRAVAISAPTPGSDPMITAVGRGAFAEKLLELAFEHEGKSYYLAGHKEVRDAAPTELWKATTTLYTRLHEGTDKEAPVVAAGVLSLGVKQLMALVSTMRVTNAGSHAREIETMMKFGRFFMGDLWDTYVKHAGR